MLNKHDYLRNYLIIYHIIIVLIIGITIALENSKSVDAILFRKAWEAW
jgi:hypothetical protein